MTAADYFFEKIEAHHQAGLPFVCFSKQLQMKAYLQCDYEVYEVDNFKNSGFVFCPFSDDLPKIVFPSQKSEIISSKLEVEELRLDSKSFQENQKAKITHENLVEKAVSTIKSTELQKIVCSRKIKISASIYPLKVFRKLAQKYQDAYSYCWYHPGIGLWLGATPEQFINVERNRLKTVALAGTMDAQTFPSPKWSSKEIEEQQMVTDFIVNALKSNSNKVNVSKPETVKAGQLWHLKTNISADIVPVKLDQIIADLHPTSAVCGLPKNQAELFIKDNENYNRQYYTGFLGELNARHETSRHSKSRNQEQMAIKSIKKVTDLYVNLRCMQVFDDHVEVYVGGGITKDSNATAEYQETLAKSKTMLCVL